MIMKTALDEIVRLKSIGIGSNRIENLLLGCNIKGSYRFQFASRVYVDLWPLSWLVVEAHNSGFVSWMEQHPNKNVVHHIDFDPSNDQYKNLQVLTRSEHARLHDTSNHINELNRRIAISEGMDLYYSNLTDPSIMLDRTIKIKESLRQYWNDDKKREEKSRMTKAYWSTRSRVRIPTNDELRFFKREFTVGEYAKHFGISIPSAHKRLVVLRYNHYIVASRISDISSYNLFRSPEVEPIRSTKVKVERTIRLFFEKF